MSVKQNRYGIVINLKVDKRATMRNKIRRRIREIIQNFEKEYFPPKAGQPRADKQGHDIIILTKESVKELKYKKIEEKLLKLFSKAGLVNNISN